MELSTLTGWLLCALLFQLDYYRKSQTCKDLQRTASKARYSREEGKEPGAQLSEGLSSRTVGADVGADLGADLGAGKEHQRGIGSFSLF